MAPEGATDRVSAHVTVGACLWRVLLPVGALMVLEGVWEHTRRRTVVGGLGLALGLLVAAALVRWPRWFWRALASVRMAVALFVLILVASLLGTLIFQESTVVPDGVAEGDGRADAFVQKQGRFFWRLLYRTPAMSLSAEDEATVAALAARFGRTYAKEKRTAALRDLRQAVRDQEGLEWAARHGRFLVVLLTVLRALRLTGVFHSWWFAALLATVAVNIGFCCGRRLRWRWRRIGFAAIHGGVVVVLAGAALGRLTRREGVVLLSATEPVDQYTRLDDGRAVPLGFGLALQGARTEYARELTCAFPAPRGGEIVRHFAVAEGTVIRLGPHPIDAPARYDYTVTVEAFLPQAWPTGSVESVSTEPRRPAVEMVVSRPGVGEAVVALPAEADVFDMPDDNHYKMCFRFARSDETYEAELNRTEEETLGTLTLALADESDSAAIVVTGAGQEATVALGGTAYRVEVLEMWADALQRLQRAPAPTSRQRPRAPALRIRLTDPEGVASTRWVFEDERIRSPHGPMTLRHITTSYQLDPWLAPTPQRYVVVAAPGKPTMLISYVDGRRAAPRTLTPDVPIAVSGTTTTVTFKRLIGQAVFPLEAGGPRGEDEADADGQPGIRLAIDGPAGHDVIWLRANTPGWDDKTYLDGVLRLIYRDNTEVVPLAYRAQVAVYQAGRPVRQRTIEVNRPLKFGGYLFYQEDPLYRYLKVVRDPSLPVVYGGLVLLLAGAAVHFLVIAPLR